MTRPRTKWHEGPPDPTSVVTASRCVGVAGATAAATMRRNGRDACQRGYSRTARRWRTINGTGSGGTRAVA